MIIRNLKDMQEMMSGDGLANEYEKLLVQGVSIDSRTIKKGNLFIPIVRIKDGHKYVKEAMAKGAIASLWDKSHSDPPKNTPLIFVENTLTALQTLANSYRKQLPTKVIGVTGSNGKTTVKDMVNSIVSTKFKVHKTKGNLNSQIGLPLTILEVSESDEVMVLEMGMSERGQIERLSNIAQPDIVIITMIGLSHIGNLGSRKEIANAKLEILTGLKDNGLVVYNGDEPLLQKLKKLKNKRLFRYHTFGKAKENDLHPSSVSVDSEEVRFCTNSENSPTYTISLMGKHNVYNALASIAVGKEFGMKEEDIVQGLKDLNITDMRMQKLTSAKGFTIINDAWNASPSSVQAAIDTLQKLSGYNKKFLVLADMLELGDKEEEYHKNIGRLIDPSKIDFLFTYGPLSKFISNEARKNLGKERVNIFTDKNDIAKKIITIANPCDIVLIKGSRGMALEDVVKRLL
ncbi:UDP-N-acetylmuramoyl-tripeptide--D-alanyl-D-alanine ligase [Bacillus sp. FSL K6-3431]|uniref:UDP-N-acetylmuramoyl-tripeptide--D-alanyl-D- alanine ligase n=1 Tax=Bacillus sp. FSL K6-3431 TaxID=2921500 RepID=UPI0030F6AF86